ncbi:MAG: hypothetical protein ACI9WU_004193 [Myxococcota bacterium]|jgi:hypothetical protein
MNDRPEEDALRALFNATASEPDGAQITRMSARAAEVVPSRRWGRLAAGLTLASGVAAALVIGLNPPTERALPGDFSGPQPSVLAETSTGDAESDPELELVVGTYLDVGWHGELDDFDIGSDPLEWEE